MSPDDTRSVEGSSLCEVPVRRPVHGKRMFDIAASTAGLLVLAPVLGLIWLLVRLTSPGRAIYRGRRVGLGGKDFDILKFRTMWDGPTNQLTTALHDPRITPIGRRLRHYKLDELPQLVNVLHGDMSIVGPRPEFRRWVDLYSSTELRALSVRPGLTDFASVEFINLASLVGSVDPDSRYISDAFVRKNVLRVRYVDEIGWSTDMKLIVRTLAKVLRRQT